MTRLNNKNGILFHRVSAASSVPTRGEKNALVDLEWRTIHQCDKSACQTNLFGEPTIIVISVNLLLWIYRDVMFVPLHSQWGWLFLSFVFTVNQDKGKKKASHCHGGRGFTVCCCCCEISEPFKQHLTHSRWTASFSGLIWMAKGCKVLFHRQREPFTLSDKPLGSRTSWSHTVWTMCLCLRKSEEHRGTVQTGHILWGKCCFSGCCMQQNEPIFCSHELWILSFMNLLDRILSSSYKRMC